MDDVKTNTNIDKDCALENKIYKITTKIFAGRGCEAMKQL